jgi:hypothetical protein
MVIKVKVKKSLFIIILNYPSSPFYPHFQHPTQPPQLLDVQATVSTQEGEAVCHQHHQHRQVPQQRSLVCEAWRESQRSILVTEYLSWK